MPCGSPTFWATGNPILAANLLILTTYPLCALATYAFVRRFTGAPAAIASCRAAVFDPIWRIAAAGGPMNTIPAAAQASAKSAFSLRNP